MLEVSVRVSQDIENDIDEIEWHISDPPFSIAGSLVEHLVLPSRCASRASVPVGTWWCLSEVAIFLIVSTSADVSCCAR